jgi:hypothetical protein
MAGVDFMTIAKWLEHKDGGILIGKVYGHLLDEHRQRMAAKVRIGITSKNRRLRIPKSLPSNGASRFKNN